MCNLLSASKLASKNVPVLHATPLPPILHAMPTLFRSRQGGSSDGVRLNNGILSAPLQLGQSYDASQHMITSLNLTILISSDDLLNIKYCLGAVLLECFRAQMTLGSLRDGRVLEEPFASLLQYCKSSFQMESHKLPNVVLHIWQRMPSHHILILKYAA